MLVEQRRQEAAPAAVAPGELRRQVLRARVRVRQRAAHVPMRDGCDGCSRLNSTTTFSASAEFRKMNGRIEQVNPVAH